MNTENNKEDSKANEPANPYKNASIKIFHSFEEQEEYELIQVIKQSPVKRIKDTVELILRTYGLSREKLSERKISGDIKIMRYKRQS